MVIDMDPLMLRRNASVFFFFIVDVRVNALLQQFEFAVPSHLLLDPDLYFRVPHHRTYYEKLLQVNNISLAFNFVVTVLSKENKD